MAIDTVEKAINSILGADGTVAAITNRIYPNLIPQSPTWPLIVYQKISGPREHDLGGPSGMAHPRYQIESWATTYTGAKALAAAIRGALDGHRGSTGTVRIGSCLLQGEWDSYEPDVKIHRIVQDYIVWHEE